MPQDTIPAEDLPKEIVRLLAVALRNLSMYTSQHPAFEKALEQLCEVLGRLLGIRTLVRIHVGAEHLLVDQRVMPTNPLVQGLRNELHQRGIQGVTFLQGLEKEEIRNFLDVLSARPQEGGEASDYVDTLMRRGVTHIQIHPILVGRLGGEGDRDPLALLTQLLTADVLDPSGAEALQGMLLQDPGSFAQAVREVASSRQRGEKGRDEWVGERLVEVMSSVLSSGRSSEEARLRERMAASLMGLDVSLQLAFFRHAVERGEEVSRWAREIGELLPDRAMAHVVAEAMVRLGPSQALESFLDELVPLPERRAGLVAEVERKLEEYGVSKEEFLQLLRGEEVDPRERLERLLQGSTLTAEDLAHAPDLIRMLCKGGRTGEARRAMERFFNGLNHPEREVRYQVASHIEEVFGSVREMDTEGRLGIKVRDFVVGKMLNEPDQEIYRRLSEGLEQVAWSDLRRGNVKEGLEMLQKVYSALDMSQEEEDYVKARRGRMVEALSSEGVLEAAKRDLFEGDQEARKRGMWVFQLLGERGAELLIEALGQEEQMSRRMRLIQVLVSLGGAAVAPLKRALMDHRWYLVRNAVRILGEIGDSRVISALVGLLEHPEDRVRKEVVQALGLLGTSKAEEAILKALEDKEEGVRVKAFEVLPSIGGPRARQKVLDILSRSGHGARKDPITKARALRALAVLGNEADVDLVSGFLIKKRGLFSKMEPEEVRRSAVAALGGILERTGSKRALKALRQALSSDPSPEIQKAIQKALESAEGAPILRH